MITNFEKRIVVLMNNFHWRPLKTVSGIISNIEVLTTLWILIIAYSMSLNFEFGLRILLELIAVFVVHYIISEGLIKRGLKIFSLQRKRPFVAYPKEIKSVGRNFSDSSFPSSHVASVTGGLVVLYVAYPAALPALLIFGMLLGLSRIYNGMHYPSDVLAGAALGLCYGWSVILLARFFA